MAEQVENKRYTLITGASSGIGAACAIQLSKDRNIILAGSNEQRLQETLSKCAEPERHIIWRCDFTQEQAAIAEQLAALIQTNEIVVDEYVHCAGMTKILPIKDFQRTYVDQIFNVNFFSIVEILRVLLKRANKRALKNVVLISALVSVRGNIGNSIYAASKGAINSLVYSLSQELAPTVRINALMPGYVQTPMSTNLNEEYLTSLAKATPLGVGQPADVVNYIEFLLSDQSRWITGQTINVDGGLSTKL